MAWATVLFRPPPILLRRSLRVQECSYCKTMVEPPRLVMVKMERVGLQTWWTCFLCWSCETLLEELVKMAALREGRRTLTRQRTMKPVAA